jgi:hypothetical protein
METLLPEKSNHDLEEELVEENYSTGDNISHDQKGEITEDETMMSDGKELSVKEALFFAWKVWRSRPWFVTFAPILIFLVTTLVLVVVLILPIVLGFAVMMFLKTVLTGGSPSMIFMLLAAILTFLFSATILFVIFWVGTFVSAFQLMFSLEVATGTFVSLKTTFKKVMNFSLISRYLGGIMAYTFLSLIGLLLFVVPGIIWGIKYIFVPWLILDKKLSIKESFKVSAEMTQGRKKELFIFWFFTGLILLIPQLVIGILLFTPIYLLISTYVYLVVVRETERLNISSLVYSKLAVGLIILLSLIINILSWVINFASIFLGKNGG